MTEARTRRTGRARQPSRLRTRLALALLAVFLPIAALLFFSHLEDLNDRRDARIQSIDTIGNTMSAVIASFVSDLETLGVATAGGLAARDSEIDQQTTEPLLQDIMSTSPTLRAIIITDPSGRVLATDNGRTEISSLAE